MYIWLAGRFKLYFTRFICYFTWKEKPSKLWTRDTQIAKFTRCSVMTLLSSLWREPLSLGVLECVFWIAEQKHPQKRWRVRTLRWRAGVAPPFQIRVPSDAWIRNKKQRWGKELQVGGDCWNTHKAQRKESTPDYLFWLWPKKQVVCYKKPEIM